MTQVEPLRARNRFGLGARPGERDTLDDPRGWLRAQVTDGIPWGWSPQLPSDADLAAAGYALRMARENRSEETQAEARHRLRDIAVREGSAVLTRRVTSPAPFEERLVAFWSNHLCVSAQAIPLVGVLAGHYERTAIRPHVLGRFDEMLLASARHPAMLFYLDNFRSIGPGSRAAAQAGRRGRERGLTENYARELLELHTVGVDGGYTQADVEALARVLTGWTADQGTETSIPRFMFRPALHEPGGKTVLGMRYAESGEDEGVAVIRDLARHPATAQFLATKLVRHFVADEPPAGSVERIASVYRETEGDLRAVALALVDLEAAWDPANTKFRTPHDWLVAALRAVNARQAGPEVVGTLRALRQPLWSPAAPNGYDDRESVWADPDSLMNRAELARTVARRVGGRVHPPVLLDVVEDGSDGALAAMLEDASIPADERVALALAGPAFQWR